MNEVVKAIADSKFHHRLCTIVAVLFALMSLSRVSAQEQAATSTASIDGTVVRQGTDDPIPGAVVTLTPLTGVATSTTSGEDGKFSISGLPPGPYQLTSTRSGFVKTRRSGGPSNFTLVAGQRERGIRIQLTATGVITGRVVDSSGRPVTNASVFAVRPELEHGRQVIPVCQASARNSRAQTDDKGEYRIFGLEPNDYYLSADREGVRCGNFYYPGVIDPADAVLQTVRSGSETGGINFQLQPMSRYSVRFKIIASRPVSSQPPMVQTQLIRLGRNGIAVVESIMSLSPLSGAGETFTDGTYTRTGLLPGSYELFINYYIGAQIGHTSFVISDHDVDGGMIVIPPSVALPGQVQAPDGVPADWSVNRARVVLSPLDLRDRSIAIALGPQTGVAPDGSFLIAFSPDRGSTERLGRVAEGLYQVSLNGLVEDQYLASARYGGVDILDTGLLVNGPPPGPLTMAIKTGGRIEGIVRNARDEAVADSRVVIVPAQNHRRNLNLFKAAFSDQNGKFSLRGVAPGDYSILAWEDVESGAWENAEYLKEFENRSMRISVLAGTSSNVNIRLIPAP